MTNNFKILFLMSIIAISANIFGEDVCFYGGANTVNTAITMDNGDLLLGTNNGLIEYNRDDSAIVKQFNKPKNLNNLSVKSICKVMDNYWIGTDNGSISKMDKRGHVSVVNTDISIDNNSINKIYSYKKYLLLGLKNGISLYDTDKNVVKYTAVQFDTLTDIEITDILIDNDTLSISFLKSGIGGVINFPDVEKSLTTIAFREKNSWNIIKESNYPVKSITKYNQKIFLFEGVGFRRDSFYFTNINSITNNNSNDSLLFTFDLSKNMFIDSINIKSKIVSVTDGEDSRVLIGSDKDFLFVVDNGTSTNYKLEGRLESSVQGLFLSRDNDLWIAPVFSVDNYISWSAITRYDGRKYYNYNGSIVDDINGYFGKLNSINGYDVKTFAEDSLGGIWFSDNGNGFHHYSNGKWESVYFDGNLNSPGMPVFRRKSSDPSKYGWSKSTGIACNSKNFLWGTFYSKNSKLFVYDIVNKRYKTLLAGQETEMTPKYIAIDKWDNLLLSYEGVSWEGRNFLEFLDGSKDPFTTTDSNLIIDSFSLDGVTGVECVKSTGVGSFIIGTREGLYFYSKNSDKPLKLDIPKDYSGSIKDIAIERNEDIYPAKRTTFWAAIKGVGVVRIPVDQYFADNSGLDSISLFVDDYNHSDTSYASNPDSALITLNETNGFSSIYPVALAYDSSASKLWIGYDSILSSYVVEVGPSYGYQDNSKVKIYPNPYSINRHKEVVISNVAASGFVDIYTISGSLVAHLTADNGASAVEQMQEVTAPAVYFSNTNRAPIYKYKWTPPSGINPGTYLVAVKNSNKEKKEDIILTKLLILP